MKNKKGFVFIETIIMIVVLAASLLILYTSYSASINDSKNRLLYDDVSHIYRNYYLLDYLLGNSQINDFKDNVDSNLIMIIGSSTSGLFDDTYKEVAFQSIVSTFNVSSMYLVTSKLITDNYSADDDIGDKSDLLKNNALLRRYIDRMNVFGATSSDPKYFFVVEYTEKGNNDRVEGCVQRTAHCKSYYASLEIPKEKMGSTG